MGFILSKIWGRESTSQQIERIQKEIVSIQDFKRDTQAKQNSLTRTLNILFSLAYALAIILGLIYAKFYYHNPNKNMDFLFKFKIILGFILAPITFIYLKRSLSWWFNRRLSKNEGKLKELRDKKYKILDEVTEKETFKVAREILEKYAPESLSKYGMVSGYRMSGSGGESSSSYSRGSSSEGSSSLRHRLMPEASTTSASPSTTSSSIFSSSRSPSSSLSTTSAPAPRSSSRPSSFGSDAKIPPYQPRPMSTYGPPPRGPRPPFMRPPNRMPMGPPPPRPVVPAQKGILGKLVDYVVGEGPGSRYALICNQCQRHNGMAQEEAFEYTAYRCCYCHYWNPPKKQKPIAPKLVLPEAPPPTETKKAEENKTEEDKTKNEATSKKDDDEGLSPSTPETEEAASTEGAEEKDESTTNNKSEEDPTSDDVVPNDAKEEETSGESKSDSESDIDIIGREEALEAMEVDTSSSILETTTDKEVPARKEE